MAIRWMDVGYVDGQSLKLPFFLTAARHHPEEELREKAWHTHTQIKRAAGELWPLYKMERLLGRRTDGTKAREWNNRGG
jgi:hypothetical protein